MGVYRHNMRLEKLTVDLSTLYQKTIVFITTSLNEYQAKNVSSLNLDQSKMIFLKADVPSH